MREIQMIAEDDSTYFLLLGLDAEEMSSFGLMTYIEHKNKRAIDFISATSLGYCTYIGGDLYKHNSDEVDRLELFGERKEAKIGVVANQEPRLMKVLDSIMLDTNGKWCVESVIIPPNMNYPNGQESRIPAEMFIKREGIYQAEFLRNMKTKGSTAQSLLALTGEPLRGNDALITLKCTETNRVSLFRVTCNMTASR